MKGAFLMTLVVFPTYIVAQYTQTTTVDNGKPIYVPTAGSTSSVQQPGATPTIVYNCQQMPLICENVAAWANSNGGTNGNLPNPLPVFFYDPDNNKKETRRNTACGCFQHDNCPQGISNGKRSGDQVTDIATSTVGSPAAISPAASNVILAGVNPNSGGTRTPLQSIPGRFFGQGTAFTCDEFPPAPLIEGGTGAKTICAMSSWAVFQARNGNPGKWPLPVGSGIRWEQDWQATVHGFLRSFLGVGGSKGKSAFKGWGTVYPFFLSTATLNSPSSKAWLIAPGQAATSTKPVTKRGMPATEVLAAAETTWAVSGDGYLDEIQHHAIIADNRRRARRQPIAAISSATSFSGTKTPLHTSTTTSMVTPAPALGKRQATSASSCTFSFDQSGDEDIEVGDPGFDPTLPSDESTPQCGEALVTSSDLQNSIKYLDSVGDDGYQYDDCCGGGEATCVQVAVNGSCEVDLCGGSTQECVGCAEVANYLQGILGACASGDDVGGSQRINEANALTVSVNINDTT